MSNKFKKISNTFQYDDKTKLEFCFYGIPTTNKLAEQQLETTIQNIFTSRKTAPNITESVQILKTIFRDMTEQSLNIFISSPGTFECGAYFYNDKLNLYIIHQMPSDHNKFQVNIEYNLKKGVHFSIDDKKDNKIDIAKLQTIKKIINKETDIIYQLQQIKPIALTEEEETICTIYRLFYQENPNFSKTLDRIKAQSMLAFLLQFEISIPTRDDNDFYYFSLRSDRVMVTSEKLSQVLENLAPLGEIPEQVSFIKLNEETQKNIESIGQEIRNEMSSL